MAEETMTETTDTTESQTETVAADEVVTATPEDTSSMPDDDVVGNDAVERETETDAQPDGKSDSAAKVEALVQALSEDQIKRAKDFGFTDSDLARIRSNDELEYHMGFQLRLDEQRRQAAFAQQQAAAEASKAQADQAAQKAPAGGPRQFQLQLTEDVAPEVAEPLKAMHEFYANELGQAQQQLQRMAQTVMGPMRDTIVELYEQAAQARLERFDGYVASLGDEWADVFGKGSTDALDPQGKELKARLQLLQAGDDLARGRQTAGQRIADAERWKRGLGLVFGDQVAKRAAAGERQKVANQLAAQKGRMTARPTGKRREIASKTPHLDAKFAELGLADEDNEE